jgi:glycine C-acetyltransferase
MLEATVVRDGIDSRLDEFIARRSALKSADRYFYLQPTVGCTNHRVTMKDGRDMVQLASYSYLGLIGHPRIDEASRAAIDEYGTGAGGVRLLTGTTDLHERLEARIAAFARRPDACVYSSGYVTNIAIITALTGPGDLVVMDKLDHASIVDGCLLSGAKWHTYRHNDMDHLEKLLAKNAGEFGTILVVADSVFSMDGDILDLPAAKALCEKYGARLMVDEAHSVGSLGDTGHGIEEHFDMYGSIDLKMGTLSKSIPSVGGYLAGSHELVDYMRHMSRPFIFSAALPPAQSAAALVAFDVIEDEPWRVAQLHENQRVYAAGLKAQGWDTMASTTCVVPVLVGDEAKTMDLTRMLFDRNIFVCPIVHPAVPKGMDRLRTCLMATHTPEDITQALGAFAEAGEALGLI